MARKKSKAAKAKKVKAVKRPKKPKPPVLDAETGKHSYEGMPAELISHARQVMGAMNKLPPGEPLTETDREEIRRALAVLTNGQVGGIKFKHKDPREAKRRAWQKLKHYAETVADKAAEQVGKRAGDAVVDVVKWVALAEALKWFLGN